MCPDAHDGVVGSRAAYQVIADDQAFAQCQVRTATQTIARCSAQKLPQENRKAGAQSSSAQTLATHAAGTAQADGDDRGLFSRWPAGHFGGRR